MAGDTVLPIPGHCTFLRCFVLLCTLLLSRSPVSSPSKSSSSSLADKAKKTSDFPSITPLHCVQGCGTTVATEIKAIFLQFSDFPFSSRGKQGGKARTHPLPSSPPAVLRFNVRYSSDWIFISPIAGADRCGDGDEKRVEVVRHSNDAAISPPVTLDGRGGKTIGAILLRSLTIFGHVLDIKEHRLLL